MNLLLIVIVASAYIMFMLALVVVLKHKNHKPTSLDHEVNRSIKLSEEFKRMKGGMKWRA